MKSEIWHLTALRRRYSWDPLRRLQERRFHRHYFETVVVSCPVVSFLLLIWLRRYAPVLMLPVGKKNRLTMIDINIKHARNTKRNTRPLLLSVVVLYLPLLHERLRPPFRLKLCHNAPLANPLPVGRKKNTLAGNRIRGSTYISGTTFSWINSLAFLLGRLNVTTTPLKLDMF